MDYYEIEGKRLFIKYGIPSDPGVLCTSETDLDQIAYPLVVKAQVLSGKRGKAGGIRFADTPGEAREAIEAISLLTIGGNPVQGIVLTPKVDIHKEHYLGYTIDSAKKRILLIYTPCGGMDIEEVAALTPEKLIRLDMTEGFLQESFLKAVEPLGLEIQVIHQVLDIAKNLYRLFVELDATTVEINPLAESLDGQLQAADAKLVIDDNALYRQGDYTLILRSSEETDIQKMADVAGLSYVELDADGNIGIIAGGAGIGMATMDTVKHYGGRPFNFMDLGGGVSREKMCTAAKILIGIPQISSIFINVFGGINNCLVMAQGITDAIAQTGTDKLVVVKSRGFSQEEGWKLYDQFGLSQVRYGTTDDAVKLLLTKMEAQTNEHIS